jgi:hypothetical protein
MSRGLAGSSAGTACVQANGGDAPVPHHRETLIEEGNNETLPVVGKGLGSRTARWLREWLETDFDRKAVEWILVIVLGWVFWLLFTATLVS